MRAIVRTVYSCITVILLCLLATNGLAGVADDTSGPYSQWRPGRERSVESSANLSASKLGFTLNYGNFIIKPYVGLRYTRDDNVYWDSTDQEDDGIFTFAPGVLIRYGDQERHWVQADYSHEWHFYDTFTEEDYTGHRLDLQGRTQGNKTFVTLGDNYTESRTESVESQARLDERRNYLFGDVEHVISKKTSFSVHGSYDIIDYDPAGVSGVVVPLENAGTTFNPIDYEEYRAGGRLYFRALPKTDFFADYTFGIVELDDQQVPGSYGDADYHEISVGARGEVTAKTDINGRVGYQRREFTGDIESIDEWTAAVGINSTFSQRFRGGCNAVAGVTPSITTAGDSVHSARIAPILARDLFYDYFTLTLRGSYEWADYYTPSGQEREDDQYWDATAQLDWNPFQAVSVGIGYTHQENRGNASQQRIERDLVFFRLGASY